MLDLNKIFSLGISNLNTWRIRYEKKEYPNNVVINIFYRNYTVMEMWRELTPNFLNKPKLLNSFDKAFEDIHEIYGQKSKYSVGPLLSSLMEREKNKDIGGVNYNFIKPIIDNASKGNNKSVEEIEYVYLFQLLKNECIFCWLALGRCGEEYKNAFLKSTGIQTGGISPNQVGFILPEQELASRALPFEMYVQFWLNNNYKPLPKYW